MSILRIKLTTTLLIVAIVCASCAEITPSQELPPQPATPTPKYISFQVTEQSAPLGAIPEQSYYAVITKATDWNSLVEDAPTGAVDSARAALSAHDALYLLAYIGVRGSSGYAVNFNAIYQVNDQYTVVITETTPDPQSITEPAKTLPYVLAAIPLTELPQGKRLTFIFTNPQGTILGQDQAQLP